MRATKRRLLRLAGALTVLSLTATACGRDPVSSGGSGISGTINISGSSTVAPITTRVAEQFAELEPGVAVNVDGPGTGDGFKLFCEGETDISDASRAIKKEEAAACAAKGIEYVELKVGIDGLTVMTSPDNKAVTCLNFADLYALAGPESQGKDNWKDAQALATELGSKTQLPSAEFDMSAPGEESGTYDSFVELALQKIADKRAAEGKITKDQAKTTRPDYQSSGDDNIIIQGIEGSKSSFGWVGFSYAEETSGQVKEIAIAKETGTDCIKPTVETIASGKYPLARNLYIYVNAAKAKNNPAIVPFVDFYLGDGIGSVTEVKYVALAPADLATTKRVWTARTLGTRDGGK
ncbi:MAG TPA: substrate-binding domain-containing protein [Acidimicrobiales bacterium]|nr:substrate-binding domain-containing protein [Acidimicrobiales bacterium]